MPSRGTSGFPGSPGGESMTTSQCSKSQPSRRIDSLGGRLLQFGDESRSDDVAGCDEKSLAGADGDGRCAAAGRWLPAAAARGRRGREETAAPPPRRGAERLARRSARDADAIGKNPRERDGGTVEDGEGLMDSHTKA